MRRRCRSVHDFNPIAGRGLRCNESAGHRGPCKPKAWEPMSQSEYRRLTEPPSIHFHGQAR